MSSEKSTDPKRELLRHLLATIAFRFEVAVRDAPPDFHSFQIAPDIRTPGHLLAHIGDLIEGSHHLMKGEMVYLNSEPIAWENEISRVFSAIRSFDSFLASNAPMAEPIEKLIQGPVADALTHIGQIVMLRRAAGSPVPAESYFMADIVPGR